MAVKERKRKKKKRDLGERREKCKGLKRTFTIEREKNDDKEQ